MQKEPLSYENLLEKSKEWNLPFSNILGGAVLEDIVYRISESEYGEKLYLRNHSVLGRTQYEKKLILNLEYVYTISKEEEKTEKEIMEELAESLKEDLFYGKTDSGIAFYQREIFSRKFLKLQLLAEVEDMKVPVSLKVYLLMDEKRISQKESFACMMYPEITVSYNSLSTEEILTENFFEIITKLELITNIGAYYDIYELLDKESIDGRKTKEYMDEQCGKSGISKEKNLLDFIAGYKNYTYMKKKWKVFLRSVNSREPSWETVIERFLNFFGPIWEAVIEDRVFFGDWMPELNRFL